MRARKAIKVCYEADGRMDALLVTFRDMVNWAITYALAHKITSRFRLRDALYQAFRERYHCHSHYPYNACEVALAMVKNSKRKKMPVAKHLFLKLDNQAYKLEGDRVMIPIGPRERIALHLQLSEWHRRQFKDASHLGSLTLTPDHVVITIDNDTVPYKPRSAMAFDTNERSLDGVLAEKGELRPIRVDLGPVQRVHEASLRKRASVQRRLAHNHKRKRVVLAKIRGKERRRVDWILHNVSKKLVDRARRRKAKIVLEDLKGIRRRVRKGKATKALRRRLNVWTWRRLHDFIKYKAEWTGVPVETVRPAYTSRSCPMCGWRASAIDPNGRFECGKCEWTCDRQMNAALNILRRSEAGRWFSPMRPTDEVMTEMRAYGGEVAGAISR